MPKYIYYDMVMRNFISNQRQHLRFNEVRGSPLVTKASDYSMSIVRFQLSTFSLPVFFCDIQKNQSNVNLTPYSIVLRYQDKYGTDLWTTPTYVIWSPEHVDATVPKAPSEQDNKYQDFNSEYYYGYSYFHFVNLVNNAFIEAMSKLVLLVPGLSTIEPPIMSFDSQSNRASIYARASTFDELISIQASSKIEIYFNQQMQTMFHSFPYYRYSNNESTRQYKLRCNSAYGINITSLYQNTNQFVKITQETSTVSEWCPVSSIIFTTSTIPVFPNQLSNPVALDSGQIVMFQDPNASVFSSIITDLAVDESLFRPSVLYSPEAEYRMITLIGGNEIRNLEISVFWKDKLGRIREFYLPAGGSASLKIMFMQN